MEISNNTGSIPSFNQDATYKSFNKINGIDRGYTGHVSEANILQGKAAAEYPAELIPKAKRIGEHMDDFGLINMNGRVYACLDRPVGIPSWVVSIAPTTTCKCLILPRI